MPKPPFAPVADEAPTADDLTDYDQKHLTTYLRLLDADADGVDWKKAARTLLHTDPASSARDAPGRRIWRVPSG